MSIVKQLDIAATLPWDWSSHLAPSDAQLVAGLFLNPVMGVILTQEDAGSVPNEHGGRTKMLAVTITGVEALSWPYLTRLVGILARAGVVERARALDVENDNCDWATIPGPLSTPADGDDSAVTLSATIHMLVAGWHHGPAGHARDVIVTALQPLVRPVHDWANRTAIITDFQVVDVEPAIPGQRLARVGPSAPPPVALTKKGTPRQRASRST